MAAKKNKSTKPTVATKPAAELPRKQATVIDQQMLDRARTAVLEDIAARNEPTPVLVLIQVENDGQGNPVVKVDPNSPRLSAKQQLLWFCIAGQLEIRFSGKASPFVGSSYEVPQFGFACSGTRKAKASKGEYDYLALVTLKEGSTLVGKAKVELELA